MTPDRLPQATLVGVPADRVFVRFKGVLFVSRAKALLQHLPGIDDRVWATQARDRALWASSVRRLVVEPQNRRTAAAHRHHMQPVRTRRLWTRCSALPARTALGTSKVYSVTSVRNIRLVTPSGSASIVSKCLGARVLWPCTFPSALLRMCLVPRLHLLLGMLPHALQLPDLMCAAIDIAVLPS